MYICAFIYTCIYVCKKVVRSYINWCLATASLLAIRFFQTISAFWGVHPSESYPPFITKKWHPFTVCHFFTRFQTSRSKEPKRRLADDWQLPMYMYIYICKHGVYVYIYVMVSSGHLEQIPLFFGLRFNKPQRNKSHSGVCFLGCDLPIQCTHELVTKLQKTMTHWIAKAGDSHRNHPYLMLGCPAGT